MLLSLANDIRADTAPRRTGYTKRSHIASLQHILSTTNACIHKARILLNDLRVPPARAFQHIHLGLAIILPRAWCARYRRSRAVFFRYFCFLCRVIWAAAGSMRPKQQNNIWCGCLSIIVIIYPFTLFPRRIGWIYETLMTTSCIRNHYLIFLVSYVCNWYTSFNIISHKLWSSTASQ